MPRRKKIDYWIQQELDVTMAWWDREFNRLSGKPDRSGSINWDSFQFRLADFAMPSFSRGGVLD